MSLVLTSTSPAVFRMGFKRLLEHWTPFTVTLVFLGTGFGMLSLYIYTKAIGRVDIFMSTLDAKSALLVWVFVVMFIMSLQLAILTGAAWFYGMSVSMLNRRRDKTKFIALWFLVPLVCGFTAFMVLAFYWGDKVGPGLALLIVSGIVVLTLLLITRIRCVQILVHAGSPRSQRKYLYLPIAWLLLLTVLSGTLPTLLILDSYVGQDNPAAVRFVAIFSVCTFVVSLMPALLFFSVKGSVYRRACAAVLSVMILFIVFLLTARGTMSSITYSVAGKLEIRQTHTARFILEDQVKLGDLDALQWHTRLRDDGRVQVQAYQLFSFGDLLLICPTALRSAKLHQLPNYSKLCLFTRASLVHRLPPRMSLQRQPTAAAIWTQAAIRLVKWERVRIALSPRISLQRL